MVGASVSGVESLQSKGEEGYFCNIGSNLILTQCLLEKQENKDLWVKQPSKCLGGAWDEWNKMFDLFTHDQWPRRGGRQDVWALVISRAIKGIIKLKKQRGEFAAVMRWRSRPHLVKPEERKVCWSWAKENWRCKANTRSNTIYAENTGWS